MARHGKAGAAIQSQIHPPRDLPDERFEGYFFGRGVASDNDFVVFASISSDVEAIKSCFGENWQKSFLPPGYESLIDECSVRHIDLTSGWHVEKEV